MPTVGCRAAQRFEAACMTLGACGVVLTVERRCVSVMRWPSWLGDHVGAFLLAIEMPGGGSSSSIVVSISEPADSRGMSRCALSMARRVLGDGG